jgi:hypothetical protein
MKLLIMQFPPTSRHFIFFYVVINMIYGTLSNIQVEYCGMGTKVDGSGLFQSISIIFRVAACDSEVWSPMWESRRKKTKEAGWTAEQNSCIQEGGAREMIRGIYLFIFSVFHSALSNKMPITVAAPSEALTLFARSNAVTVASNPT